MSSRIPNPLIPATGVNGQWTDGEPVDDVKLHQRIDGPLETMGGVARTWNTDAAHFFGYVPNGVAVAANTPVLWTEGLDLNGNDYNPANGAFTCPVDGLYLFSASMGGGSTPFDLQLLLGGLLNVNEPDTGAGPAVLNGGACFCIPLWCVAGDAYSVRPTGSFTVTATGLNYFFVHQLTWA